MLVSLAHIGSLIKNPFVLTAWAFQSIRVDPPTFFQEVIVDLINNIPQSFVQIVLDIGPFLLASGEAATVVILHL